MKKLIACIALSTIGMACKANQLTSFGECTQRAEENVSACYGTAQSPDPDRTESAELLCNANYGAALGGCNQMPLSNGDAAKRMSMPSTPSTPKP
jgi:hypothetical protein